MKTSVELGNMQFYSLDKLMNLHDGYRKLFKIDQYHLLLIQRDEQLYLIESLCPHRGHSLASADVFNDTICCPLHRYSFSLLSGKLLQATEESCKALKTYEIAYQGNDVGVWL